MQLLNLEQIKKLSNEEKIVRLWDLQDLDKLFKFVVDNFAEDKSYMVLLMQDHDSYFAGKVDEVINAMFNLIQEICQRSGLKFETVMTQVVANLNQNIVKQEQIKAAEGQTNVEERTSV